MKFSAEELYDVAREMYRKAGFDLDEVRDGIGQWAHYSAEDEYADLEEVKEELAGLIETDKKLAARNDDYFKTMTMKEPPFVSVNEEEGNVDITFHC